MSKPTLLAILGTILLAAAILLNSLIDWDRNSRDTAAPRPPAPAATEPSDPPPAATPSAQPAQPQSEAPQTARQPTVRQPTAPSFDVVRINPDGDAVLAGRAQPGADVTVRDGETVIGRVQADDRGEWVLVPDKPLPPGSRVLNLSSKSPNGDPVAAQSELVLVVPDRDGGQGALALRVPNVPEVPNIPGEEAGAATATVLQSPFTAEASRGVAIGVIEYDETGKATVSGRAQPDARIEVQLDDSEVGTARADASGEWQLSLPVPIAPGDHRLRVEQRAPDGTVAGRSEYDFARRPAAEGAPPTGGIVVVESGNSLWRIARRTYGSGIRYTLIVEANRQQIRDPDLIYPGQVFELPRNR